MLQTYKFNGSSCFYYDIERKTVARFPTKSNLAPAGSDNSLYFGIVGNKDIEKIFCDILEVKKVQEITQKKFNMRCGYEFVDVICNINAEGQIQVKIAKNGTMFRLTENYSFSECVDFDFTKMLIVVDFRNNEIRFKDPNEFLL